MTATQTGGDPASGDPASGDPASGDSATATFQAERPRLLGLAYRLLGSVADADDVVQEAWIRWSTVDHQSIERPAAWLTTVVSRLGLDRLQSRRRERVDYVGPWLPEPLVRPVGSDDPEQASMLADSLTTTFLVMLERLSPEERLVVLLVDVFGEPFHSVATLLDRTDESCRQLAVRYRSCVLSMAGALSRFRSSSSSPFRVKVMQSIGQISTQASHSMHLASTNTVCASQLRQRCASFHASCGSNPNSTSTLMLRSAKLMSFNGTL